MEGRPKRPELFGFGPTCGVAYMLSALKPVVWGRYMAPRLPVLGGRNHVDYTMSAVPPMVLPGQKSGVRAGFRPDLRWDSLKIRPVA